MTKPEPVPVNSDASMHTKLRGAARTLCETPIPPEAPLPRTRHVRVFESISDRRRAVIARLSRKDEHNHTSNLPVRSGSVVITPRTSSRRHTHGHGKRRRVSIHTPSRQSSGRLTSGSPKSCRHSMLPLSPLALPPSAAITLPIGQTHFDVRHPKNGHTPNAKRIRFNASIVAKRLAEPRVASVRPSCRAPVLRGLCQSSTGVSATSISASDRQLSLNDQHWHRLCVDEGLNTSMIHAMFFQERAHHDLLHRARYSLDFLSNFQNAVHRQTWIDWLMKVAHAFELNRDIVATAVDVLDRFWALVTYDARERVGSFLRAALFSCDTDHLHMVDAGTSCSVLDIIWRYCDDPQESFAFANVGSEKYQATAITSLWMASKRDDACLERLSLVDCTWVTNGQIHPAQLHAMETDIVHVVGGRLRTVSCFRWLHMFMSRARLLDDKQQALRTRLSVMNNRLACNTLERFLDSPLLVDSGRLSSDVYRFQYMAALIDLATLHDPLYFRVYHSALAAAIFYVVCQEYFHAPGRESMEVCIAAAETSFTPSSLPPLPERSALFSDTNLTSGHQWFASVCGYRFTQIAPIAEYVRTQLVPKCPLSLLAPQYLDDYFLTPSTPMVISHYSPPLVPIRNGATFPMEDGMSTWCPPAVPAHRKSVDLDSAPFQLQVHHAQLLVASRELTHTPFSTLH